MRAFVFSPRPLPVALLLLLAATAPAQSFISPSAPLAESSLPSAPLPIATAEPSAATGSIVLAPPPAPVRPRLHFLDWAMLGAASTLRVLDYTSTEQALSHPQYLHEAILPTALVSNKPAFAAFQAGTVVVNYVAYRLLVRRHLRSLARASQYVYVSAMTWQVAHNYQLIGRVPSN
jgi:hypothetical protein